LKTTPPSRFNPNLKESIPDKFTLAPLEKSKEWDTGAVYAEAQNLARTVCFD
jgi:aminopeptidase